MSMERLYEDTGKQENLSQIQSRTLHWKFPHCVWNQNYTFMHRSKFCRYIRTHKLGQNVYCVSVCFFPQVYKGDIQPQALFLNTKCIATDLAMMCKGGVILVFSLQHLGLFYKMFMFHQNFSRNFIIYNLDKSPCSVLRIGE